MSDSVISLDGLKIFVVEDEALIAIMLEDILLDLNCLVAGPHFSVQQATDALDGGVMPDAAILDVNVGGQQIYPVAEMLRARGVPLVFATGYGQSGLDSAWASSVAVMKPYLQSDIVEALKTALKAS